MVGLATLAVGAPAPAQFCASFWLHPTPRDPAFYGGYMAVFDDGSGPALYTDYSYILNGQHGGFARWTGRAWQRLDQGVPPLQYGMDLFVLDDGAGPRLYGIAELVPSGQSMWVQIGAAWQPTAPGFFSPSSTDFAIPQCSLDDGTGSAIYGIRSFYPPGTSYLAKWDHGQWMELSVVTFAVGGYSQMRSLDLGDGPAIYLSGIIEVPGVPNSSGIARWDGHQWHALGFGLSGSSFDTRALAIYDDGGGPELYVGGALTGAGNVPDTSGLAKWNGQRWAAVPGHSGAAVRALCVFDDGTGPGLYVTGDFLVQGGVPCRHIARYDHAGWHPLGDGVPANSAQMAAISTDPRGPSLFVWTSSSGSVGGGMPGGDDFQWVGCPNCYANCDNSTAEPRLNVLDFICFLNKFAARDPYANCTVDATIDVNDFVCFMSKFAAGCP